MYQNTQSLTVSSVDAASNENKLTTAHDGYAYDLAFIRVEFHLPVSFPLP